MTTHSDKWIVYGDEVVSVRATCSCGKTAILVRSDRRGGPFVPQEEGWIQGDNGWFCGEDGHEQVDSTVVSRGIHRRLVWEIHRPTTPGQEEQTHDVGDPEPPETFGAEEIEALDYLHEHLRRGVQIIYVPDHADQDEDHPDCERGFVTSVRGDVAFCRYWSKFHSGLRTVSNSEATPIRNLVIRDTVPQEAVDSWLAGP